MSNTSNDEIREHVSDIMFEPQESPDPNCELCLAAVKLGLWREYGVDEPFSDSYEASLPSMDEVRADNSVWPQEHPRDSR